MFKGAFWNLTWLDEKSYVCALQAVGTYFPCVQHCKEDCLSLMLWKCRFSHNAHITLILGFERTKETWSISSGLSFFRAPLMLIHHPTYSLLLSLTPRLIFPPSFLCVLLLLRKPVTSIPPHHPDYSFKVPSTPPLADTSHFSFHVWEKAIDSEYWNIQELTHKHPSTKLNMCLSTHTLGHSWLVKCEENFNEMLQIFHAFHTTSHLCRPEMVAHFCALPVPVHWARHHWSGQLEHTVAWFSQWGTAGDTSSGTAVLPSLQRQGNCVMCHCPSLGCLLCHRFKDWSPSS